MSQQHPEGQANAILQYSFLHVFANDKIIDAHELAFIEKLALEDGKVDDEERKVLALIFKRGLKADLSDEVREEIQRFCHNYGVELQA